VYRAHTAGLYSTMPALKARIFNIEALIRYNYWLGFRYLKQYAFSLNRLSLSLLKESKQGALPSLSVYLKTRYGILASLGGLIYDLLDRYPRFDPAVFWYGESPKAPSPRLERLAGYKLP